MFKFRLVLPVTALLLASGVHAQTANDVATGNMHFDAKDIDADHDGKISMDEMMKYGDKMWNMMAKDAPTIPVTEAAKDFARGNLKFSARMIDTDHDGTISKEEFMAYAKTKFEKMQGSDGMVSVGDAAKAFSRGNTHSKDTSSTSK
jgi:hypothetical protein